MSGVLVLGACQAGLQAAVSLRDEGFDGAITMVGDEPHLPYQRPPLSKGFVTQAVKPDQLWLRNQAYFDDHHIALALGERVVRVDRREQVAETASGRRLGFDSLVLATGSSPRPLPVPGADLEGVLSLRTLDDAESLVKLLSCSERLVVVGGGFIGLEVAATATALGVEVTVVEATESLMGRAVSPQVAEFFLRAHRERGVGVRLGEVISEIVSDGHGAVEGVRLASGALLPAAAVLVGIGAAPNTELARDLGVETAAGVLTDQFARTSDARVLAAGDCAEHRDLGGQQLLLTSVQNAIDQASVAARTIMGDLSRPYDATPWFWSDQHEYKLQMAGLPQQFDAAVLRGSPDDGAFTRFHLRGDRIVWAESVSRPGEHVFARRLIAASAPIDPVRLADTSVPMREVAVG